MPDCRGSREITVLTDSQGKLSDRTNKERKRKQLRAEKRSGWSLDTRDASFLSLLLLLSLFQLNEVFSAGEDWPEGVGSE